MLDPVPRAVWSRARQPGTRHNLDNVKSHVTTHGFEKLVKDVTGGVVADLTKKDLLQVCAALMADRGGEGCGTHRSAPSSGLAVTLRPCGRGAIGSGA